MPELRVVENLADGAVDLFLEVQPRTIVLAGGQTPAPFYRRLAKLPYPWDEVDCFFGDERCVPPDHPRSNYRMAHETLLSHVGARVHLMPGETCDAAAYESDIRTFFKESPPSFDFVVLGIGRDGHTASLFPNDAALEEQERLVVRVTPGGDARLTLTYPALERARCVLFLVSGESKREVARRVLAGEDCPATRVRGERVILMTDRPAAP